MTFTTITLNEGTSAEHYVVDHVGRSICSSTSPYWAVQIANAMNAAQAQEDPHRDAAFSAEVEATCSPTAKLLEAKDAEIAKLRKSIDRAIGELRGIGDDDSTDDILAQCDYARSILKEAINPKPNDT